MSEKLAYFLWISVLSVIIGVIVYVGYALPWIYPHNCEKAFPLRGETYYKCVQTNIFQKALEQDE